MFGPSLEALSGSGCTSINNPFTPTAIAALERVETCSLWPPEKIPFHPVAEQNGWHQKLQGNLVYSILKTTIINQGIVSN